MKDGSCHPKPGPMRKKGIPIIGHEGPWGGVDVRVHIYTATALERGRVASPTLGHLYSWGEPLVLIL